MDSETDQEEFFETISDNESIDPLTAFVTGMDVPRNESLKVQLCKKIVQQRMKKQLIVRKKKNGKKQWTGKWIQLNQQKHTKFKKFQLKILKKDCQKSMDLHKKIRQKWKY